MRHGVALLVLAVVAAGLGVASARAGDTATTTTATTTTGTTTTSTATTTPAPSYARLSPSYLPVRCVGAGAAGLIHFLQRDVPARSVVLGDLGTSYRITAFAPVYVVAVPPTHAANTWPNELHKRRLAVLRFLVHPTLAVPRTWRAQWIVLNRDEPVRALERQGLRPAYEDKRFVVFGVALPLTR